jgi:hypothetical protein
MSWMLLLGWLRRHWQVVAVLAGVALLTVLFLHALNSFGDRREAEGRAAVTAQWQADTAARDAVNAAEIERQRVEREARRVANDKVLEDYNAKLIAAAGERDNYFRMLQRARGEVRGLAAGQATGALIASTAGEASIAGRIDRAVAGVIVEARNNADQLDALIAVIQPQVAP